MWQEINLIDKSHRVKRESGTWLFGQFLPHAYGITNDLGSAGYGTGIPPSYASQGRDGFSHEVSIGSSGSGNTYGSGSNQYGGDSISVSDYGKSDLSSSYSPIINAEPNVGSFCCPCQQGPVGPVGPPGDPGPDGSDGEQGKDGDKGKDGQVCF